MTTGLSVLEERTATPDDRSSRGPTAHGVGSAGWTLFLAALLVSGASGLINQVVWQRGLKVFLGGCETLSSLVVVLVFILGLGVGSAWMGARAHRVRRPLRRLAAVEGLLCAVNIVVAVLLSLDLTESIYAIQRIAVGAGVPLRLLYALAALVLLLPPCLLMGITMPLAAEAAESRLRCRSSTLLSLLFFVNTLGAVGGALASGFLLLPLLGQRAALGFAAALNVLAAVLLVALASRVRKRLGSRGPDAESTPRPAAQRGSSQPGDRWLTPVNIAGFLLGFLALAWEMVILRLVALAHQPLPYTFATTLSLYLLLWSIGALLASRFRWHLSWQLLGLAALVAVVPGVYDIDRFRGEHSLLGLGLAYFLPCVLFGSVFGHLVSRVETEWGRHVGRFSAFNTAGCCAGILVATLIGYEQHGAYSAWAIAFGVVAVYGFLAQHGASGPDGAPSGEGGKRRSSVARRCLCGLTVLAAVGAVATTALGVAKPYTERSLLWRSYHGRDGVIEISNERDLVWDGLWHSRLSNGEDHVGTTNWLLATAPAACYRADQPIRSALVIGLGTGVTAATLTGIDSIERVVVYDINRTLEAVLADYPEGTLHVADDPRIELRWQDGRSGLALDLARYDLITQQPLWLEQAGSSILLSVEYLELVRSRLEDDGVFCVYSNSRGNAAQGLLVRETIRAVFPHCVSFLDGYLVVASRAPIRLDAAKLERLLVRPGRLWDEVRRTDERLRKSGKRHHRFLDLLDTPDELPWSGAGRVISDDHPLVEYPGVAGWLIDPPGEPASR